jgi:hypothetical protein
VTITNTTVFSGNSSLTFIHAVLFYPKSWALTPIWITYTYTVQFCILEWCSKFHLCKRKHAHFKFNKLHIWILKYKLIILPVLMLESWSFLTKKVELVPRFWQVATKMPFENRVSNIFFLNCFSCFCLEQHCFWKTKFIVYQLINHLTLEAAH